MMKLDLTLSSLSIIAILACMFLCFRIYDTSQENQELKFDLAEIQDSKYGLFNAYDWKRQVSDILSIKIEEFQLTDANKENIRESIETALHKMLTEIERIIQENQNKGGTWERLFKDALLELFEEVAFGIDDLKDNIPQFADIALEEIDNPETRKKLKDFLLQKIDQVLESQIGKEDRSGQIMIFNKYRSDNLENCKALLATKIQVNNKQQMIYCIINISIVLLLFLIWYFSKVAREIPFYTYSLILTITTLLFGGIITPMIDIDARISSLHFELMGDTVGFTDQVIFFQSKSIWDVVVIMIKNGEILTILVGVSIFIFSVLLPLVKLTFSALYIQNPEIGKHKLVETIIFKSGKWSMADVIVVAIFMAFIGFRGILSTQMQILEDTSKYVSIDTTENTSLQVGFALFIFYCFFGLMLSDIIKKGKNTQDNH